MRSRIRATLVGSATAVLLLSSTGLAFADSVVVGPDVTRAPGEASSFVVGLVAEGGIDPINNCNANGGNPVTVSFSSSNASVVAAPGSVQLTGCDDPTTQGVFENVATVNYAVSSAAADGASVTITASASDGRGIGNPKVYGTFNPDSITIAVATPLPSDSTAPKITPIAMGTMGQNDWYTSDVTVTWSVSDDEGPVLSTSGCDPVTITKDTPGQTLTCTATSAGGSSTQSVTIKRDATAPNVRCDSADGDWHATNVSIECTASDGGSQLTDNADAAFFLSTAVAPDEEISNAATDSRTVFDQAGNSATAGPVSGNKVDRKAPTVACDAADAVWRNGNVTIGCKASDAGSGLADIADAAFSLSTTVSDGEETSNASTGSHDVADALGNSFTAGPISGIKVDRKAPTVTWSEGAGQSYYFGDQVTAPTCTAVDGGSGLAGECTVSGFETTVGTHALTATATDNVGNVEKATLTYTVQAWTLGGFYSPVDMGKLNTVKAGATVPLKFNVFKGSERLTSNIGATFSVRKTTCGTDATTDAVEEFLTTGSTSLRYDSTSQQWIQNWATPRNGASGCYRVTMTTADGSSTWADFKLK